MSTADPKILVVEDELITAQHLKQSLTRLGYHVIGVAASGRAAIQAAERDLPDLMLADIRLQGNVDGIEVAAQFQRRLGIPTIFLSALADSETLKRAQVIEPYGYLVKPFSADDLHATIEIGLYRKALFNQRRQVSEANLHLLERTKEELYRLAAQLTTAQEDERKRIARDLHDDLGQRLALLQMEIEQLEQQISEETRRQTALAFQSIIDHVTELSEQLRRISHGLHPPVLEDLGLEVALRQLTEEFEDRHSVRTRFSVRGVPTGIPSDTALSLYRIAQEALTNVAKHAAADSVDITLAGEPDSLTLFVRDSGQGFNPDAVKECGGLGLISMRQRAELIGGTLEVQSARGQGTQIVVCAPLKRTA
jgi:signal transduction histidine kinase